VMLGLKDFEIQTIVKNVKSRVKKLPWNVPKSIESYRMNEEDNASYWNEFIIYFSWQLISKIKEWIVKRCMTYYFWLIGWCVFTFPSTILLVIPKHQTSFIHMWPFMNRRNYTCEEIASKAYDTLNINNKGL
jgi:hypothetical protein